MNKGDLIENVAGHLNESKAQATRIVDAVLEGISRGVQADGKVNIAGFGSFEKKQRAGRMGVHPITKAPMEIQPSTTVGFKPSLAMKSGL